MKISKILILPLFLFTLLKAVDTLHYDITLLGIKVAAVEIVDSLRSDNSREIMYRAFTVGVFDKIYDVDNRYYFYSDSALTKLDSLKKVIHEKSFNQFYSEHIREGIIHYSDASSMPTILPVHHALSLLIYLQYFPQKRFTNAPFSFLLSDEGELYHPEIRLVENVAKNRDEVYFMLYKVAGRHILETTDVFNRIICSAKGERMMAYSREDNKISEGYISLSWGLHLRAKRVCK